MCRLLQEYHDKDVGYVDPDSYLRQPQHPHAGQFRDVFWKLSQKQLKPQDWKKLALNWEFTPDHVRAIEQEYTGICRDIQRYREGPIIGSDWTQMGQIWDFLRSVSVYFGFKIPH